MCRSSAAGSAAEIGAMMSGAAPMRLAIPLTAKTRVSTESAVRTQRTSAARTAVLSTVSAMRSVMPSPMAAGISSVPTIVSIGRTNAGCKNGAAGISQNPSPHVSSRMMPMPMGRAAVFCCTYSRSTRRMPTSVKYVSGSDSMPPIVSAHGDGRRMRAACAACVSIPSASDSRSPVRITGGSPSIMRPMNTVRISSTPMSAVTAETMSASCHAMPRAMISS